MKKLCLFLFLFLCPLVSVCFGTPAPALFYSDLTSGPNSSNNTSNGAGVYVTIWGSAFGTTQGSSTVTFGGGAPYQYLFWSNTEIIVQLGPASASGSIQVYTSNGFSNLIPFTVRTGRIFFVNPSAGSNGTGTEANPFNLIANAYNINIAGDTTYVRAGNIQDIESGYPGYKSVLAISLTGTQASPIAYVAYPNETAITTCTGSGGLSRVWFNGGNGGSAWITISKFKVVNNTGDVAIGGANGWRVVGNDITDLNLTYGAIDFINTSNMEVLGNTIHDGHPSSQNNLAHSIYIDGANSNFEVGWNYMYGNYNQGWEISCYHNGPRIGSIHDNLIVASHGSGSIKGILVDGCGDGGTDNFSTMYTNNVKAYNNIIVNAGQYEYGGALQVNCGTNYIYNNTIYGSGGETMGVVQFANTGSVGPGGGHPVEYFSNNIIVGNNAGLYLSDSNGVAPTWTNFSLITNNNYYGEGNGPTQDAHPINSNPQFVSPSYTTGGDFSLQSILVTIQILSLRQTMSGFREVTHQISGRTNISLVLLLVLRTGELVLYSVNVVGIIVVLESVLGIRVKPMRHRTATICLLMEH